MSVVPEKRQEKIVFYEQHLPLFSANTAQIGLSAAEVTDLQSKTTAARTALDDHLAARQAAKIATEAFYNAVDAMATTGAGLIDKIRGQAKSTGNLAVYTLSGIPAPATPTPTGDLNAPGALTASLDVRGALTVAWKCAQPLGATGVTYQVWRRIGTSGTLTCLGGTGEKEFTDETIPQGSTSVTYQIQATRSTSKSPWAQLIVTFGMGTGGTTIASISESAPAKTAA